MRKGRLGLLLAGAALVVSGCTAQTAPRVSFYADGESVRSGPMSYCNALAQDCVNHADVASLSVGSGNPVQISLPDSVAETPWKVIVEYRTADGEQRQQGEVFTGGNQYAYTANPPGANSQVLVVEIQQIGAAYATNKQGEPLLDPEGNPLFRVRGVWSLQVEPQDA